MPTVSKFTHLYNISIIKPVALYYFFMSKKAKIAKNLLKIKNLRASIFSYNFFLYMIIFKA